MDTTTTVEITTPSDLEVTLARLVDAPRALVWAAWTTPELVQQWMLGPEGWSMPVCEMDLRPGGAWHRVWKKANGKEMEMRGSFREIVAPERLVSTEKWGPEWPETVNTLTLEAKGEKTLVRETILYPSKEARDAAIKTGMADGASVSFDRLQKVLLAKRSGRS